MGGSASSSPAVQRSLENFMDAALSTTVDGLRSTGKRIKKGNAALSDAMRNAYDEVNLLDPARQIGLTSQGRGDPSIMRSINTPLVAGAQMGLGAANAAYRGTANILGQGVEGVRSALPKSLSDYVGTGAQFERDFNAMPEFLAGTGFGLIPGVGPRLAGGFTEGTAARNAERGMVKLTDDLPMDEASRNLVRLPNEIDAKKLNEVMEEMKVLGRPRIDVVDTGEEYLALEGSHRLTAAHKLGIKPIYNIVDQNAIINPNKYDVDTYNFKWDEDSPHSAGEMAFEMYGDGKNGRLDFGKLPNDLPMDEASRMARATSKYKPKIVDGSTFPDPDTQKGRMAIQGGPLAAKPGIDRLITTLDSHGMDWKYSENGGITAYAEVRGADGKWFKEGKHFDEKSSLKTLRNWLGY